MPFPNSLEVVFYDNLCPLASDENYLFLKDLEVVYWTMENYYYYIGDKYLGLNQED